MSKKKKESDGEKKPRTGRRKLLRRVFLLASLGLALVVGGVAAYAFEYSGRVAPRVRVAGQPVGGLTREQALAELADSQQRFLSTELTLTYQDKSWKVKPKDLGVSFANGDGIAEAYQYAKTGSTAGQIGRLLEATVVAPAPFSVSLSPIPQSGKDYLTEHGLKDVEKQTAETTLDFTPGAVKVAPGKPGQLVDYDALQRSLYAAYAGHASSVALQLKTFQPEVAADQAEAARAQADAVLGGAWTVQANGKSVSVPAKDVAGVLTTAVVRDASGHATGLSLAVRQDALNSLVDGWSGTFDTKPANAVLKAADDGSVQIAKDAVDGVTVDKDKTGIAFQQLLSSFTAQTPRTLAAVSQVAHPAVRAETLADLGIRQRIGTGTTNFSGSSGSRVHNITTGAGSINGVLVKDGDEFSTLGTLGPIDQAHGYVSGLVILNNQTVPADGGGLCQVSTTLFRAVLNAGLPVTARQAHSYEVSYYQRGIGPGLDATIYSPAPDFKWKNDTGHAVYVQSSLSGTSLTFDLYGTGDGRSSSIEGPHTLSVTHPSGTPIYVTTNTLSPGQVELIDPPIDGAKTTATYTVTRGGQVINRQVFNSSYQAMPAQYLIGPNTAAPTPTPTATPQAN